MDKAYSTGVSGGNGWQRLWQGTRLQYFFDKRPGTGYETVRLEDHEDGEYVRLSVDGAVRDNREEDLESAWVKDNGVMWNTRDPAVK